MYFYEVPVARVQGQRYEADIVARDAPRAARRESRHSSLLQPRVHTPVSVHKIRL